MVKAFKKHVPSIQAEEAHGVGPRKVILSPADGLGRNLQALTHGVMRAYSKLPSYFVHADKDEVIYVVRGSGLIHFKNQESLSVEAGDIACIPAGTELLLENPSAEELEAFFLRIRV